MRRLNLDCGRLINVKAFYYQWTYEGFMIGRPNRKQTDLMLEGVRTRMVPLWGEHRVHVIPPVVNEKDPDHPRLPRVQFAAHLYCDEPIDEQNDASELVVVWFQEECPNEPLDRVIWQAIRSLPWNDLAEDFIL
jgi:hypothetical protein